MKKDKRRRRGVKERKEQARMEKVCVGKGSGGIGCGGDERNLERFENGSVFCVGHEKTTDRFRARASNRADFYSNICNIQQR